MLYTVCNITSYCHRWGDQERTGSSNRPWLSRQTGPICSGVIRNSGSLHRYVSTAISPTAMLSTGPVFIGRNKVLSDKRLWVMSAEILWRESGMLLEIVDRCAFGVQLLPQKLVQFPPRVLLRFGMRSRLAAEKMLLICSLNAPNNCSDRNRTMTTEICKTCGNLPRMTISD